MNGFTKALVDGTGSLKKVCQKSCRWDPLKKSDYLYLQKTLGTKAYYSEVIGNSDIVQGIKKCWNQKKRLFDCNSQNSFIKLEAAIEGFSQKKVLKNTMKNP